MNRPFLAIVIILLGAANAFAQTTQPATQPAIEFEQYQLVILRSGDAPGDITHEQAMEIQKQHLAHMRGLGEAGKLVIAGPFSDQPDKNMRGMCLYRVGSVEEAKKLAEEDPAVKAGRLKVEVMTWNVQKGFMEFPRAPVPKPDRSLDKRY